MNFSTRNTAYCYLGIQGSISLRSVVHNSVGLVSPEFSLRAIFQQIQRKYGHFALPPKVIPAHPRLAPIPAIHFDHYNSSVTNLPAPGLNDKLRTTLKRHGLILGTCLNFLADRDGYIYGFCGNLKGIGARIEFKLSLFDDKLDKIDEIDIATFPTWDLLLGNLPLNLGYFCMDNQGRVLVIKNKTKIVFIQRNKKEKLKKVKVWDLEKDLKKVFGKKAEENGLAQVMPTYDLGYWAMGLGNKEKVLSAYLIIISDQGEILGHYEFNNEVIENGMAVDQTGAYIVTDRHMYKLMKGVDGTVKVIWKKRYAISSKEKIKPGVLSKEGSGSTPTLFGIKDDLVAITDNADWQINLLVYKRNTGERIVKHPLFYFETLDKRKGSANENSVIAHGDSVIVQNWFGANDFTKDMSGLVPGLVRIDIDEDRNGHSQLWWNESFGSTATVRLSTQTGLIYGTIQLDQKKEAYAMAFIDFHTGKKVREVYLGKGAAYRISMSPAYLIPGKKLLQPVRKGVVVIEE